MSAEYTDQFLRCVECQCEFVLTSGQQRWFLDKQMTLPKRCEECRKKKREERESGRRYSHESS